MGWATEGDSSWGIPFSHIITTTATMLNSRPKRLRMVMAVAAAVGEWAVEVAAGECHCHSRLKRLVMVVAAPVGGVNGGEVVAARASRSHIHHHRRCHRTELQPKEAGDGGGSRVCEYGMLLAATASSPTDPPGLFSHELSGSVSSSSGMCENRNIQPSLPHCTLPTCSLACLLGSPSSHPW